MIVSIIAAVARKRVIGKNNQLPWHLPEDLQYFKKITMGNPVIMGRRTYESIGKPLPGRQNIVVTRGNTHFDGCETANSFEQALKIAKLKKPKEAFIIGGEQLYKSALRCAERIYLTEINISVKGDAFFPHYPSKKGEKNGSQDNIPQLTGMEALESILGEDYFPSNWQEVERQDKHSTEGLQFSFVVWQKIPRAYKSKKKLTDNQLLL